MSAHRVLAPGCEFFPHSETLIKLTMNEPNTDDEQNEFETLLREIESALRFALRCQNRAAYLLLKREFQTRLGELASAQPLAVRPITRSRVF